jgi:hypothetical protein
MTKLWCTTLVLLLAIVSNDVTAFAPLKEVYVSSVAGKAVDLGDFLSSGNDKTMLILGTYAADFNAIEYAQRLRYYLPQLQDLGVNKCGMVLNCRQDAALALCDAVDLDTSRVAIMVDNDGQAGRAFDVGRGWLPNDENVSPFLKLFGMLFGLGAAMTLPAVIGGYIGNPFVPQPWIEDAMAVGIEKGRWPNNALEICHDGTIVNKFEELPLVGGWKRRPLELATLRLQNMLGISIKNWNELAPDQDALDAGVLTQLGACIVYDNKMDQVVYEWRDPGICAVANFEEILTKLKRSS